MAHLTETGSQIRRYKKAVILNCVREYAPISRTRICQLTGIGMSTITDLAKELVEEGSLIEAGADQPNRVEKSVNRSNRGRKRVLLRLRPDYAYAVGLEFDASHVIGVVEDAEANVVHRSAIELPIASGQEHILAKLTSFTKDTVRESGIAEKRLIGVGIAVPGVVDKALGTVALSTTMDGWRDVPLRKVMEEALSVSVYIDEATRAKTLAEKRCGLGKDVRCFVFIEFGEGIGCGVMTPEGLYHGETETACELGHVYVTDNGPVCRCGSQGCLEAVASLPAIAGRAARRIREGATSSIILQLAGGNLEDIRSEHVFEAARRRDKLALGVLDETWRYLGIGIANAVNLLAPKMVILDGRLADVQDLVLEPIERTVKRQAVETYTRDLRFAVSQLGSEAGALGGAIMVLDAFFHVPQLHAPRTCTGPHLGRGA